MVIKRPFIVAAAAAAAAAGSGVAPSPAAAVPLAGVDTANRVVLFNSASLATIKRTAISGLADGEKVLGIDRRPADGRVYVVSSASRLYTLDPFRATVTPVGAGLTPGVFGNGFGFDFNPVVDRIRLTSNYAQNLRLQPDTGAVAATDKSLVYAAGDPNAGTVPTVAGSAYTNNVKGTMATQLLDIDTTTDSLALQDPPNDGGLKTIGKLNAGDVTNPVAFDISATGKAFATLKIKNRQGTQLYSVNVASGRASPMGRIGRSGVVTLVGLTVLG